MGPAIVWAVLVGVASVTPANLPGTPAGGGALPIDLLFHVVGYGILGALLVRGGRCPFAAVLLAVAFGLGIEGVQSLLPHRTASSLDALANLVGASIGASAATVFTHVRESRADTRSGRQ